MKKSPKFIPALVFSGLIGLACLMLHRQANIEFPVENADKLRYIANYMPPLVLLMSAALTLFTWLDLRIRNAVPETEPVSANVSVLYVMALFADRVGVAYSDRYDGAVLFELDDGESFGDANAVYYITILPEITANKILSDYFKWCASTIKSETSSFGVLPDFNKSEEVMELNTYRRNKLIGRIKGDGCYAYCGIPICETIEVKEYL